MTAQQARESATPLTPREIALFDAASLGVDVPTAARILQVVEKILNDRSANSVLALRDNDLTQDMLGFESEVLVYPSTAAPSGQPAVTVHLPGSHLPAFFTAHQARVLADKLARTARAVEAGR